MHIAVGESNEGKRKGGVERKRKCARNREYKWYEAKKQATNLKNDHVKEKWNLKGKIKGD